MIHSPYLNHLKPLLRRLKNRYVYTSLFFLIWVGFVDDTNLVRQYRRSAELSTIRKKKETYLLEIEDLRQKINALDYDMDVVEKYAREKYRMKKSNEDIFIFEEDMQ